MKKLFIVDLIFNAKVCISSLPRFHGARWSALMRFACHRAHLDWETSFLSVLPFRYTDKPIVKGETVKVRVLLSFDGGMTMPVLTNAISLISGFGKFGADSFELFALADAVTGKIISPSQTFTLCQLPMPFFVEDASLLLSKSRYAHITLMTPMRLTLPGGLKKSGSEIGRFAHPDFFSEPSLANISALHLLNSVRYADMFVLDDKDIRVVDSSLRWDDLAYSETREKKIGGLVGRITIDLNHNRDAALMLVYGQYVGIGKSARFGHGFYVIEELEKSRSVSLPYTSGR